MDWAVHFGAVDAVASRALLWACTVSHISAISFWVYALYLAEWDGLPVQVSVYLDSIESEV